MNEMTNNTMAQGTPWGYNAGYNTGFAGGMTYGQPAAPKMTNPLTDEELKALQQNNAFTLQVTQQELAQGICTHKDPKTGRYATVKNPDGTVTCSICHTTFDPDSVVDVDYVKRVTTEFLNVLETCKLLGVDLSNDVIRGVFQMSPFVKKIPELFNIAQTSFLRYNEANPNAYQAAANPNMWGMFNNLMMGQPPMMAPMMGQPVQNPYGQPAQMYAGYQAPATPYANMQAQMVPGGSPFYAQPATTMPMNQPTMPSQPQQPVQAQEQATEQQVHVDAQMNV